MKTKQFDLQAALAGSKVVTRDGRKATRIIPTPECSSRDHKIVAIVNGIPYTHREDGLYLANGEESRNDLFMVVKNKKAWINIYESCNGSIISGQKIFFDKNEATSYSDAKHYIETIEIEVPDEG